MRGKRDLLLKIMKMMVPFWNICIFGYVWALYYNERTAPEFWKQNMAVSLLLYLVIYLAFGKLYNAFKIGTYKIAELLFSQLLSFGIADLCLYLEGCLLHHGMITLAPGVVAVIVQFAGSMLLILLTKRYFARYIPPQRTLLVYGGSQAAACEFAGKLRSKFSHMLQIDAMQPDTAPEAALLAQAAEYGTLVLYQVEEKLRVRLLAEGIRCGKNIYLTPRIEDILLTNFENRHIIDTPLLKAKTEGSDYVGKRLLDVLFSGFMLLLFSPFMLIIALAIHMEDHGPVFYRQKRVTKDGRTFSILKFRSMIVDAEAQGYKPCTTGDARITRTGRIIRATRLDELPQLINILKGDMSIVGPRPERVEHVEKYTAELPEFAYRLRVRGGLTGYAQIYGKYNTSAADKLKMDLMYIERESLLLDLQLIFLTVKIMFIPESTEGFKEEKSEEKKQKSVRGEYKNE